MHGELVCVRVCVTACVCVCVGGVHSTCILSESHVRLSDLKQIHTIYVAVSGSCGLIEWRIFRWALGLLVIR